MRSRINGMNWLPRQAWSRFAPLPFTLLGIVDYQRSNRMISFRTITFVVGILAAIFPQFAFAQWQNYVTQSLNTLVERGTDVYGPVKSPMLMAVLDVRTMNSPEHPEVFDRMIRLEG